MPASRRFILLPIGRLRWKRLQLLSTGIASAQGLLTGLERDAPVPVERLTGAGRPVHSVSSMGLAAALHALAGLPKSAQAGLQAYSPAHTESRPGIGHGIS